MTLQEQILKRIHTERLKPTPKGLFKARDYVLWGLLGLFAAALSLGFGMIIFMVQGTDRSIFERLGLSFSERLLYSVPIFWIVATAIVALAAYLNFKRTRRGYRVSARQFGLIAAVVAVAFGSIIYSFNITKYVDQAAAENIPLYGAVEPLNTNAWFDPAHGLLSGSVKAKASNESFTLRDRDFNLWTVTGTDIALVPAGFRFDAGDHIKIIGKKTGDFQFQAIEIRPFEIQVIKGQATTTGS